MFLNFEHDYIRKIVPNGSCITLSTPNNAAAWMIKSYSSFNFRGSLARSCVMNFTFFVGRSLAFKSSTVISDLGDFP